MDKQLQLVIEKSNVTQEAAEQLAKAFGAPFTEVGQILENYRRDDEGSLIVTDNTIVVTSEDDTTGMKRAKETRLELKRVRTSVENKRKELKEDSLRTGKAIDGVANYIKNTIQPVEEYLEEQEKYAEIQEAKRRAELRESRIKQISPYCENPFALNLENITDEAFKKLFDELKSDHELKLAQAEAYEREQERLRAEKEAEDARIREENEILRKQLESQEAEIVKEREESEIVQQAAIVQERSAAEQAIINRIRNEINALERIVEPTVNNGKPMIDYASVIGLL